MKQSHIKVAANAYRKMSAKHYMMITTTTAGQAAKRRGINNHGAAITRGVSY